MLHIEGGYMIIDAALWEFSNDTKSSIKQTAEVQIKFERTVMYDYNHHHSSSQ